MDVISFYTPDYKQHEIAFTSKCREFRIPHRITQVESTGSWIANTRLKPLFILSEVREHGPCLWIDIDSLIFGDPVPAAEMALGQNDVAFLRYKHWENRPDPVRECSNPADVPLRMMGHIHAWSGNPASTDLLEQWCEEARSEAGQKLGDHRLMQFAIDKASIANRITCGWIPVKVTVKGRFTGNAASAPAAKPTR